MSLLGSPSVDNVDEELDLNVHTEWIHRKRFWAAYLILIYSLRAALVTANMSTANAWTTVVFVHAGITFILFHWVKGNPLDDWVGNQGKYNSYTFWEQIQVGRSYTPTKKFLTILPIALFFICAYHLENEPFLLFLNGVITSILVIAKLPAMHKVRIMDINKD
jgi:hypothetical protein